ncbi:proteasome (prosome, macropain) 26S subunit, non ATPase, 32, putative [Acanthamoeba castellanii str. Neff]|uniref:Proteasome (Prosome, macropain) 26S subunit, non ATPase, 32, putative n=1 Tax=Acanthamoeba castellanii (strain ATCC 30010 / Neff) TaxID=1257118 RepID=L8GZ19_ACACF|nr:proteasome (prosome, macropain) 26S subunit, non ATPase, 32, putative [Acanthamoeba castellanii str. Neff]ELR18187.1 proteasome (prosome, macropain) 26S subunit, non ATPase, 32, putative [Acanthamoeba castellanii str. Neff]
MATNTDTASTSSTSQPKGLTADLTSGEIKEQILEINKSVVSKEPRHSARALRKFFTKTRRHINRNVLTATVDEVLANENELKAKLHSYVSKLPEPMETVSEETKPAAAAKTEEPAAAAPLPLQPEVEIYLRLVTTIALVDNKLFDEAAACSTDMIKSLQTYNRRTLNPLAARAFFYYSLAHEHCNRLAEIRPTSSLRHDDETHATILNLLLRNYLHFGLYDQADKLQAKSVIKEDSVSSNQLARFRYYQGRIKGMQLDYTGAYTYLQEAIRRAPSNCATGFRVTVHKVAVIVQLLMGEIPERSVFRTSGLKVALRPYLKLTQAVRVGDLSAFHEVVKTFGDVFRADKTYTLIQRLRHNVIKTGLRKINVSYSRIRLADVCDKLRLDNVEDAEFIVAKAIRDQVIDATLDHEAGTLRSKELIDVYSTTEPMEAYHARISFCLKMHNEAVRAMRYPPNMPKAFSWAVKMVLTSSVDRLHQTSPLSEEEQKEKREAESEILEKVQDEDDDDEEF